MLAPRVLDLLAAQHLGLVRKLFAVHEAAFAELLELLAQYQRIEVVGTHVASPVVSRYALMSEERHDTPGDVLRKVIYWKCDDA